MTVKRLQKNAPLLRALYKAPPKLQRAIISNAEDDFIKCLCDCCLNILEGNVKLGAKQRRLLMPHKKHIRTLAVRKVPLAQKRQLLTKQVGRGLPLALLAPIITIAASLLFEKLK
jgi:hypothetical protein